MVLSLVLSLSCWASCHNLWFLADGCSECFPEWKFHSGGSKAATLHRQPASWCNKYFYPYTCSVFLFYCYTKDLSLKGKKFSWMEINLITFFTFSSGHSRQYILKPWSDICIYLKFYLFRIQWKWQLVLLDAKHVYISLMLSEFNEKKCTKILKNHQGYTENSFVD